MISSYLGITQETLSRIRAEQWFFDIDQKQGKYLKGYLVLNLKTIQNDKFL